MVNLDDVVAVSFQNMEASAGGAWQFIDSVWDDNKLGNKISAAEMLPCRVDYRYHVAEALRLDGKCAEAIPIYKDVLELDPLLGAAAVGLSRCLIETGDTDFAKTVFTTMIEKAPACRQLRGMYEKVFGDAALEMDEAFMQNDLRDADMYIEANFNLYTLVPER